MPTFKQNIANIKRSRRQVAKARAQLYTARLAAQRKAGSRPADEVIAAELALPSSVFDEALGTLNDAVERLHEASDYRNIATNMDAGFPVVMLPVRIETRFVDNANGQDLLLRVYPDDFHVHSFEEMLTEEEVKAGQSYWRALLIINSGTADNKEEKKIAVWAAFAKRLGAPRALWVAKQTIPGNWQPDIAVAADALVFDAQPETKTHDWTRAPQTQLLPDRFVVQIYKNGELVHHMVGRSVPDTVFLGPDPFLAEKAFEESGESIIFDQSFAWTANFPEAEKKGLGFKIPVTPDMLNRGRLDRIVVTGVLASSDPVETKALFDEHLQAHQHSTKGLSFLPLGTPTNNTETSGSAYVTNDYDLPKGYYDATAIAPLSEKKESDGLAFAKALGVSADALSEIRGAGGTQVADARSMNEALYPATIGYFFEVLSQPALTNSAQDKLREYFCKHVSSSGSIPSLRVGDQPYGVLVTSDLSQWSEAQDDSFSKGLLNVLRLLQSTWARIAQSDVAHVGKSGDADEILLNIMGLAPGSTSFRQRMGHLNDVPMSATNVTDSTRAFETQQDDLMSYMRQAGYESEGFPLISALSFYRRNDNIAPHLLVDRRLSSATRYLAKHGFPPENFIQWLAHESSVESLEKHKMTGGQPPRSILYFLLRHSLLTSLQKAATNLYKTKGIELSRLASEKSLLNFDRQTRDLTSWELLKGKPNKVDRRLNINTPIGDHLLGLRSNNKAVAELASVRRALSHLAKLPTLSLQRYLTAHLDLCSYRLDAWQTALFSRRLDDKRKAQSEGLYIGAYGWVENLRPSRKDTIQVEAELQPKTGKPVRELRGNAGFVHTPSLNHATAAGVLLAGYRNNATRGNPSSFAVNLSSDRVRRATQLVTGIQSGQSLEALLGYQLERALHDRTSLDPTVNLNQYILPLREKFAIEHDGIPQAGSEAQETVPAYSVVDGMKLVEARSSAFSSLAIPADHLTIIRNEIERLRDSLDAMGDLLTSEAAFQLVQGKGDRLAGLLNSFKDATLPPDFEINQTPRATHVPVSNKVCVSVGKVAALESDTGWARRATPRSSAEPGLNRWIGHQLGAATRIVCSVATVQGEEHVRRRKYSLADLNLQPIDLVYTVGIDVHTGAQHLESALFDAYTRDVTVAGDAQVIVEFDTAMGSARERSVAQVLPLVRYLRLMITTGKPASARDFLPRSQSIDESPASLFGWDVAAFDSRIAGVIDALDQQLSKLERKAPNGARPKNDKNPATLGDAFDLFHASGADRDVFTSFGVTPGAESAIRNALAAMSLFGVSAPRTDVINTEKVGGTVQLLTAAAVTVKQARQRLADATQKRAQAADASMPADLRVRRLTEAGQAVLGDDFVLLPEFRLINANDVRDSLAQESKQLLKHYTTEYDTTPSLAIESWLQSLSPVRPALQRLEQVRIINEFHGNDAMDFEAIQLPFRDNDSWLAVEFPAEDPETGEAFSIKDDTLSICVSGLDVSSIGGRQRVLILDNWTESIPTKVEVTGVAFNYDQPNASAPNALLVAVEPTGSDTWSWDALIGTLNDTLDRAKTRAVEPAQLLEQGNLDVLLPMTIASFDLQETNLSVDFLATNDDLVEVLRDRFKLYQGLD